MAIVSVLTEVLDQELDVIPHYFVAVNQFGVEIRQYCLWWQKMKKYGPATQERLEISSEGSWKKWPECG